MNIVILSVEQKPIIKINVEYIHFPFQIRILGGVVEMVIVELASNNNQFIGYLYIRHHYGGPDKNGCHQLYMIGAALQEDRGACL